MLYVAGEILVWIVLAALVGLVVGWLLRGTRDGVPDDRHQLVLRERDDLRAERDRAHAETASLRAAHATLAADRDQHALGFAGVTQDRDALQAEVAALRTELADTQAALAAASSAAATEVLPTPDLDAAKAVFGRTVKLDDLKLVEGIGPKIEELLHGAGITTWIGLARTPVDRLREVLQGGGERFQMHDPGTWPAQAELAAYGRWEELKDLCERLDGGREVAER